MRPGRHLLRGPPALHRFKEQPDGLLTWRLTKPDRRGSTVLVRSPKELLGWLCSVIPAPRHPTWNTLALSPVVQGQKTGGAKGRAPQTLSRTPGDMG